MNYTSNRGVIIFLALLIIAITSVINLYGDTDTLPDIILVTTTEETATTTTITTTITTSTTESEITTTTTITKITTIDETKEPDYIWFDTGKMMAHNNYNCELLNKDNAEKVYYYMGLKYIKEGRACPECGQDITVGEYKCIETFVPEIEYMTYYGGKKNAEYGSSGRQLIGCYSVASNIIPEGTYVRIKSEDGSINGLFRVDDCGCANNVIDIYFHDYAWIPEPFKTNGKVKCRVWIIE